MERGNHQQSKAPDLAKDLERVIRRRLASRDLTIDLFEILGRQLERTRQELRAELVRITEKLDQLLPPESTRDE
jgi:hypothetical protein